MKCMEYELNNMKYLVRYPDDYADDRKYPVILCLHGAGTRSSDTEILRNYSLFNEAAKFENFPFIIIAPLCSENTWFDLWPTLKALVREVAQLPRMDEKRIYLTGNSMGGYAAWQLAMSMPEYFAAIAPICGGGMNWRASALKSIPIWAFHGQADDDVPRVYSEVMVDAVNEQGGDAVLTQFPGVGHNSWDPAYLTTDLIPWLLGEDVERK